MGKLVYELEAVFDERGRAEVVVPDISPGVHHFELRFDNVLTLDAETESGHLAEDAEPPLVITEVGGPLFKWHVWEWTGVPADKVWTREDFYEDDE